MINNEVILDFIAQFRELGAENCFSNGMCYWFARILQDRFGGLITYDLVENHFGFKEIIDTEKVYDITGDVTNKYNWVLWIDYQIQDPIHSSRIIRDCINKER